MKRALALFPLALALTGPAAFVACSGYAPVNRGTIDLVVATSASASTSASAPRAPAASAPPPSSAAPLPSALPPTWSNPSSPVDVSH